MYGIHKTLKCPKCHGELIEKTKEEKVKDGIYVKYILYCDTCNYKKVIKNESK